MYLSDTIAAVATPPGVGGIGIVRVSGPKAEQVGKAVFRRVAGGGFQSHRLYYGSIINPVDTSLIDEGMAVLMRAPRSYTREDVLELHCHGGYLAVHLVLEACLAAGSRLAEPGEFTRRAFLNGRIDLCQAESVLDLISSRTSAALALAQRQREGKLGLMLEEVRRLIAEALAVLEAHIDFPEEEIEAESLGLIAGRVDAARRIILRLIDSFRYGKVLREGVSVLLVGKPNVGKSSLLNALLREERAIVSTVPGTTRDLIEETVSINGLPVRLIDAAGIHSGQSDEVEQEGIRRTLERISEADLVLFLVDGSRPFDEDDRKILAALNERTFIMVVTKADLTQLQEIAAPPLCHVQVHLSAKTGQGLDHLRSQLFSYFTHDADRDCGDMVALSNVRHRDILLRAQAAITSFEEHIQAGFPPELLAADLRDLLSSVGEITGATTPDAVLDLIFSSFCIGK